MASIAFNLLYMVHKINYNVHLSMIYTFEFVSASGTLGAFFGLENVFNLHAFFLCILTNELRLSFFTNCKQANREVLGIRRCVLFN